METLNAKQRHVISEVLSGRSHAALGMGGTGKSRLVHVLCACARRRSARVAVTALTGMAAVQLGAGATTIHSFVGPDWARSKVPESVGADPSIADSWLAGVCHDVFKKNAKLNLPALAKQCARSFSSVPPTVKPWKLRMMRNLVQTDILVVDEISMMSVPLLSVVDGALRGARRCSRPFGGLTVLFLGDFAQIPPVERWNCPLYESSLWKSVVPDDSITILTKNYRQQDPRWQQALSEMWLGKVSESTHEILRSRVQSPGNRTASLDADAAASAAVLCAYNSEADKINTTHFERLDPSTERVYGVLGAYRKGVPRTADGSLAPGMMDSVSWCAVGGSEPSSFSDTTPVVGDEDAGLSRIDDEVERERAKRHWKSASRLRLRVGARVMLRVNMPLLDLCNGSQGIVEGFDDESGSPVVRFVSLEDSVVIHPSVTIEPFDHGCSALKQVPLIHAWAITVDKSQGASLDRVRCSLDGRMRRFGQAYVACSRVRTLEGLFLDAYEPRAFKSDPNVVSFYIDAMKRRLKRSRENVVVDQLETAAKR